MNQETHSAASASFPSALTCWKDIAQYFGKGVRTVQRWEHELGLPVRRPNGASQNSPKSPVAADPRDLQEWLHSRWALRNEPEAKGEAEGVGSPVPQTLSQQIQRSRNLQAELRVTRQQHHELMRQLSIAVTALHQVCRIVVPLSCAALCTVADDSGIAASRQTAAQAGALWKSEGGHPPA